MKIATWNINGVKARLDSALTYLREAKPDVIGFQEIKSVDEGFPSEAFEDLGYKVATHGQKGFNGVAILSRLPMEDVTRGLPGGDGDEQSRYIEATIIDGALAVRFASLYLPNGNPIGTEKFAYKLAWMERLQKHARALLKTEMPVVLAGDYNVIPEPVDAKRPAAWTGDALYQPESRAALRRIEALGLTDGLRACHPGPGVYTFWDYQAGAWQKDDGIRIDHILLSPQAADRLQSAGVDRFTRGWEKPSDHAPVWVELG
jgi:exodeoxyribonuclease-3